MTAPLPPPPKRNPEERLKVPLTPPAWRSRAALQLTLAAAEGRFALQRCRACGRFTYPPRDACPECLSTELIWDEPSPFGRLLAETRIHTTPDPYFRERLPWRIGTIALEAGPVVQAHLHSAVARGDRVRIQARLDRAGQGVLVALPLEDTPHMEDDPILRAMGTHPRHRRALIVDARAPEALPLARALLEAGARHVFLGLSEAWRPLPEAKAFAALPEASLHPLDPTDPLSVTELAGAIGGKVEILIHNARQMRPGGVMAGAPDEARQAFETGPLGLMRLARVFGPALAARAADGVGNAVAWVNVLPAQALAHDPGFAAAVAAAAAMRALALSLRAEFRASGIRVLNVYAGPLDDPWHQPLPPPKLAPAALARALVEGLERGLEELHAGPVAQDLARRFAENPALLVREMESPR